MLWLSLISTSVFANQVIMPDLSATDPTSRVGAEIVYTSMVQALADRNIEFLDSDDLCRFIGTSADKCLQKPGCPDNLWDNIKGDIAVLGSVKMEGGDISAAYQFHRRGIAGPIEFFQADFPAEDASFFAVDCALIVEDLLNMAADDLAAMGLCALAFVAQPKPEPEPKPEP